MGNCRMNRHSKAEQNEEYEVYCMYIHDNSRSCDSHSFRIVRIAGSPCIMYP